MNLTNKNALILLIVLLIFAGAAMVIYFYWQETIPAGPEAEAPTTPVEGTPDDTIERAEEDVRLFEPVANQVVTSPLMIRGEAKGAWFFEASFPVYLYDSEGEEIGSAIAMTTEDWMTEDYVYFEATMNFEEPDTDYGELVLRKDNPSGLPENDDELRINVAFSDGSAVADFEECVAAGYPVLESYPRQCQTPEGRTFVEELNGKCIITGCSNQVCAEEEQITTCEYREEYACLEYAVCERQDDGECGWTETEEYKSCIENL